MTPKQMYDEFRSYLDLETDSWVGGDEVWRKLHNAQQQVIRLLVRLNASYYIRPYTLNIVAGTATYSLPITMRLGSRLIFTEDVNDYMEVAPRHLIDKLDFNAPGLLSLIRDTAFAWERNKIRIMPTPTANDTIKVWGCPTFGNMLQGFAIGGGSSALTLPTGDPNYTTDYGPIDPRDDFYNNMEIMIFSGTNIGEYYEITDYTGGSTRSISIADETWGATPDTTTEYCIMCPVIEQFHQLVPIRAAMDGAVKNKDRLKELKQLRQDMETDILEWAQERQVADFEETEYDGGEY